MITRLILPSQNTKDQYNMRETGSDAFSQHFHIIGFSLLKIRGKGKFFFFITHLVRLS